MSPHLSNSSLFVFNYTPTTESYTLSLHDALPISGGCCASMRSAAPTPSRRWSKAAGCAPRGARAASGCLRFSTSRSEEHTSDLQSLRHLVCRLLLEKKNENTYITA